MLTIEERRAAMSSRRIAARGTVEPHYVTTHNPPEQPGKGRVWVRISYPVAGKTLADLIVEDQRIHDLFPEDTGAEGIDGQDGKHWRAMIRRTIIKTLPYATLHESRAVAKANGWKIQARGMFGRSDDD